MKSIKQIKIISYAQSIIFFIGIIGAANLSFHEYVESGICPKLGPIPACYIILACLIFPFFFHLIGKGIIGYFLFISVALLLASYAGIGQLLGKIQCPKTDNGLPLCYISFLIFASLMMLKIIQIRKERI
jgi:hypothetical protein